MCTIIDEHLGMLVVRIQFVLRSTPILNLFLLTGENPSKLFAESTPYM